MRPTEEQYRRLERELEGKEAIGMFRCIQNFVTPYTSIAFEEEHYEEASKSYYIAGTCMLPGIMFEVRLLWWPNIRQYTFTLSWEEDWKNDDEYKERYQIGVPARGRAIPEEMIHLAKALISADLDVL
jgi:hypothetical protein